MFKMIGNLTKAAVSTALAPVAAAVDIVTLPVSAFDDESPFQRTEKLLKNAGECVEKALKPE